jgi:hypothetical protein
MDFDGFKTRQSLLPEKLRNAVHHTRNARAEATAFGVGTKVVDGTREHRNRSRTALEKPHQRATRSHAAHHGRDMREYGQNLARGADAVRLDVQPVRKLPRQKGPQFLAQPLRFRECAADAAFLRRHTDFASERTDH